jgi:hypothetical protein
LPAVAFALLATTPGCNRTNAGLGDLTPGIVLEQSGMSSLQDQMAKTVTSAPPGVMQGGGLAGVVGGARVKIMVAGTHEILLPMPQLAATQIPVCYAVTTTPPEAGKEYCLRQRAGSNVVVSVRLNGSSDQEVQLAWASVILLADKPVSSDSNPPEPCRRGTACVQSSAGPVKALADKLWPANGKPDAYAANIQEFIRGMKQQKLPRSMDALGILESGGNWICTANANLAAALLRAKNIPARSLAVVPPTAQRLEMHRIVEYFDQGQWRPFDPSSLHKDIPLKPWQTIIMAWTTIADEDTAMTPRMGMSLGCPYGQEIEFLDTEAMPWGNDLFWTMGKPLAQFGASDEAVDLARREWNRFLQSGKLSQSQIRAASARDKAAFLEALSMK